jgi:dGTPase
MKARYSVHQETEAADFLVDRERIITSKAFRRLEYKTQVFANYEGDHYRTRLTHSLEVAHTAAVIARRLNINHILAEIIGLAHDLGHPPFGHAGERALNAAASDSGGFDHNLQTVKIVCRLEEFSPEFQGLNLSYPVIEALVKHNGPLVRNGEFLEQVKDIVHHYPIDFHTNCHLEGQVASLADDITYLKHDIDDGIRAGFLDVHGLRELKIFSRSYDKNKGSTKSNGMLCQMILRDMGVLLIEDLITNSLKNLKLESIRNVQDILLSKINIIAFSHNINEAVKELRAFLHSNVYRHFQVNRMNNRATGIITQLFDAFEKNPNILPTKWQRNKHNKDILIQDIINYIAGMTDRYAIEEHKRVFSPY